MAPKYNMTVTSEGQSTIVALDEDGDPTVITDSHPNYLRIADALVRGEDPTEFFSEAGIERVVEELDDRVEIIDGVLHFDGDPIYNELSSTILRYHAEGRDPSNLVAFMERLDENPSRRSREQLFTWTGSKGITIDQDGYIIGYKGVSQDLLSISSGTAEVDGVEVEGHIPNAIGTVISMPRAEVQDDPTVGCSTGLHVGSWDYASGFGRVILEVRIDPADVVSVPTDSGFQKLRCCRYEVVAIHDNPVDDLSDYEPTAMWDAEDAFDSFEDVVPQSFLSRLRDRLTRR